MAKPVFRDRAAMVLQMLPCYTCGAGATKRFEPCNHCFCWECDGKRMGASLYLDKEFSRVPDELHADKVRETCPVCFFFYTLCDYGYFGCKRVATRDLIKNTPTYNSFANIQKCRDEKFLPKNLNHWLNFMMILVLFPELVQYIFDKEPNHIVKSYITGVAQNTTLGELVKEHFCGMIAVCENYDRVRIFFETTKK